MPTILEDSSEVPEDYHATFVEVVPFRTIAMLTPNGLSVNLLWSHMDPNSMSHVPFNDHDLDAAEYEEAPALPFNLAAQEMEIGSTTSYPGDSEILDEVIIRSRGEFRHTSNPKVTSSSKPVNNRSLSQVLSPRDGELRSGQMSPRVIEYSPNFKPG
ncbi:unnamed protein product [Brassica rapa]|uniref:Uncharacterized protein n=1 Tax=Brassica campestris TaxID=3711 RepID=A0A8D9DLS3_BRACM|nr:unnamed protein product [Brassica rapa]